MTEIKKRPNSGSLTPVETKRPRVTAKPAPESTSGAHPREILPFELWHRVSQYLDDASLKSFTQANSFLRAIPSPPDLIRRLARARDVHPALVSAMPVKDIHELRVLFAGKEATAQRIRSTLTRVGFTLASPIDEDASEEVSAAGLAWSPDGRWVAAGSPNGGAVVWDLCKATSVILPGHGGIVDGLAWSPDGAQLATTARDGGLRIWAPHSGQCLVSCRPGDGALLAHVSWSHDGRYIAAREFIHDGELFIVDRSGNTVSSIPSTGSYAWSGTRNEIAVEDGTDVNLYAADHSNSTILKSLDMGEAKLFAYSPREESILVAELFESRMLVWTPSTNEQQSVLMPDMIDVDSKALWIDATHVASCSNGPLVVWDLQTGALKHLTDARFDLVCASPDGSLIAGSSGKFVEILLSDNGKACDWILDIEHEIYHMAWSRDGQFLAIRTATGIRIWSDCTHSEGLGIGDI